MKMLMKMSIWREMRVGKNMPIRKFSERKRKIRIQRRKMGMRMEMRSVRKGRG